jgi:hypothetical protein
MNTQFLALTIFGAIAVIIAMWVGARHLSRNKKKSQVGGFAWALLFLSGGRMPPPPPQSQIEQETGEKKNRQIGRGSDVS